MKYLLVIATFVTLSSCQKKDVSAESVPAPAPNPQQVEVAPPPAAPNPPATSPPPTENASQYPKADIEYNQYIWTNQSDDIHIHVILSESSTEVITLQITLADSTAIYPRDYLGFDAGGPLTQTLVFPPGERIVHMPSVAIPQVTSCGTKFLIKLSAGTNEKVRIGAQGEVFLNCLL